MSKESDFEDALHQLAHKASLAGLSIRAIGASLAARARFTTYIPDHAGYPPVVSTETSARRRGHA
jgi:hypothetical protein